ncbi:MAG TPA: M3 family oligoendopeptidase [Aggregatilinea sp.]|jgi:oligoendopeptidase F|uniref:M3 family oligoendopeptidase n=1 Tax=Aggregatilinea sp. TaxID=2806333 RepID=UPI002C147360|nr:M3 family oligoendopeptidase [Aggregatilinea sp.]HML21293.1 M3 family oligoendopeptidase [Aggregatilinea sp.]
MKIPLPDRIEDFMTWTWDQIQPYADELVARPLTAETIDGWMADWTLLQSLIGEAHNRLEVHTTTDTGDEAGHERYNAYSEQVMPHTRELDNRLKEKLLASGLVPEGMAVPLRRMRAEAEVFRTENLPLRTEIDKLNAEYSKIRGAMTVEWDGEERTFQQVIANLGDPDRAVRERAWTAAVGSAQQSREAINAVWIKLLDLREQMARNAGFDSYRDYRWKELARLDYTPEDCTSFHNAIEEVVVPVMRRLNARRRESMGLDTLRVWDAFWFLAPDPKSRPALKPFETIDELKTHMQQVFDRVDPDLGGYFKIMRDEDLLDLESRKHKASGGYMTEFSFSRRPFIFTNAVGIHDDVQTLLHEGGHAFHYFEASHLPYFQQRELTGIPMEFVEVGSMAMELLGAPYLTRDQGGFYSEVDAGRARAEQLTGSLAFWPYMAVVDAFQHWIYEHPAEAHDPDRCDDAWEGLIRRFLPDFDWSGIEDGMRMYWRLQGHILQDPFYYVEYGMSQLGAVQIWRNALQDQAGAVRDYRRALSLGGTASLPDLFAAAGVKFAFDADTLRGAVELMEATINRLDAE